MTWIKLLRPLEFMSDAPTIAFASSVFLCFDADHPGGNTGLEAELRSESRYFLHLPPRRSHKNNPLIYLRGTVGPRGCLGNRCRNPLHFPSNAIGSTAPLTIVTIGGTALARELHHI